MKMIHIPSVERQARQLRAREIQCRQGLFSESARLYVVLLGSSLLSLMESVADVLRPLFSWNPQASTVKSISPSLAVRLNRGARVLFAWNPQKRRAC